MNVLLLLLKVAFGVLSFVWVVYFIAIIGSPKRSRIDWDHVYAMERAIWGQTFEHAGAPKLHPNVIPLSPKTPGTVLHECFGELLTFEEYRKRRDEDVRWL